jgi:mono/diheme cytochrome c family protein
MKPTFIALFLLVIFIAATAASQDPAPTPATGDATSGPMGKDLFAQKCALCHHSDSESRLVGPGLKGISARNFVTTGKPVTDAGIRNWILKGDGQMPSFEKILDDKQVDSLVAYLKTL